MNSLVFQLVSKAFFSRFVFTFVRVSFALISYTTINQVQALQAIVLPFLDHNNYQFCSWQEMFYFHSFFVHSQGAKKRKRRRRRRKKRNKKKQTNLIKYHILSFITSLPHIFLNTISSTRLFASGENKIQEHF